MLIRHHQWSLTILSKTYVKKEHSSRSMVINRGGSKEHNHLAVDFSPCLAVDGSSGILTFQSSQTIVNMSSSTCFVGSEMELLARL